VIVVHVAGAVAEPGVYELPAGSRVGGAIDSAGGPSRRADPAALNLAAPLSDGERVYVPKVGEAVPVTAVQNAPTGSAARAGPIDLNRASAEQLDTLPGIGPATAAAIVDHREQNGPFARVDDLEAVRGIGPAKLEAIRDLVAV
jgi:competence protein ComEA